MKIALIIGGTGMLTDVTLKLSEEYDIIGVVGRHALNKKSFFDIQNIIPIEVDYSEPEQFDAALVSFTRQYGLPETVISWIHSTNPEATPVVAKYCSKHFFQITSSPPSENYRISFIHQKLITEKKLSYHRIILGQMENRWLSDTEICSGVLRALAANEPEYIVGSI